jgi:hypothetical protein
MNVPQTSTLIPILIPVAIVVLTLLGMGLAIILRKGGESRRRAALAQVASDLGMTFTPEDAALLSQFGGYVTFPKSGAPRAMSVMRGTIEGSPVVLFDEHVAVGIGRGRHTVRQTVAAFDVTSKPLPVFAAQGWQQNWLTALLDMRQAGIRQLFVCEFPETRNR